MSGHRHLVHVGVHKTASTWLQQNVFPRLDGLVYANMDRVFEALMDQLRDAPEGTFSPEVFTTAVKTHEARGKRLVISSEAFGGDLWVGPESTKRRARRLASIFPDADVLLLVRAQPETLLSVHAQYVNEGGTRSFKRFLSGDHPGPAFDFDALEYDRIARIYRELFRADRVWVHPYELLRANPQAFVAELAARTGTRVDGVSLRRVNPSPSPAGLVLLEGWNKLFRRSAFNDSPALAALPGGRRVRNVIQHRIDPAIRWLVPDPVTRRKLALARAAAQRYASGNASLADLTGLDLRKLGYP